MWRKDLPAHTLPNYTEESLKDTLFHYTTANGLLGILTKNELWSTAYYCTNDESELRAGLDILKPIFRSKTHQLMQEADPRIHILRSCRTDIMKFADDFEQIIFSFALHALCVYITCFCKPSGEQDFLNGLLSQWRGYGIDGGYAIQFSRQKLHEQIAKTNKTRELNYELQDVYYSPNNPYKDEVGSHSDAFISAYLKHLDRFSSFEFLKDRLWNPIKGLSGGPLESLLDFLIHTKSRHFSEENECRMSVLEPSAAGTGALSVNYFNRNGLTVPYTKTPKDFNVLACVDWIIVGPSSNILNRYHSVQHMVRKLGMNIKVRPSHIPFSRT